MENVKNKNKIIYTVIVMLVVLATAVTVVSTYFSGAKYTSTVNSASSSANVAKVVFKAESFNKNDSITLYDTGAGSMYWIKTQNYEIVNKVTVKSEVNLRCTISVTVPSDIKIGALYLTEDEKLSSYDMVTTCPEGIVNGDFTTYTYDNSMDKMKFSLTYKNGIICKYYGIAIIGGKTGTYSTVNANAIKVTVTATQRDSNKD